MSPEDVTREVELSAGPDEVWRSVTEPDELGDWLEADGEVRRALVRDVEPGQRLAFLWWPITGAGVGRATTVTITIEPSESGSRLRLVESPRARARARARAVA
jgi:uncharacterized protein YndB with AHSA1/START domain